MTRRLYNGGEVFEDNLKIVMLLLFEGSVVSNPSEQSKASSATEERSPPLAVSASTSDSSPSRAERLRGQNDIGEETITHLRKGPKQPSCS
ncbi:hypothetical protein NDU88_005484 [Pleurodeles waltl]|uniref:Uncharacterized protein n=1 Tax=Pleurodeles waltl TaxID=8319 RepID=A0AAV7SM27_PLEWA|nr:hypothetical protein NDU88_005484 [Pleurodeles waltl]